MSERVWGYILEKAKSADAVIIVGAGKIGRGLLRRFEENSVSVEALFDNDEGLIGNKIENVIVAKPYKVEKEVCVYFIAVREESYRNALCSQLQALGVEKEDIVIYQTYRDYEYMSNLDEKYYEEEIQEMYFDKFGKRINWQNPLTYNEKINWEKVNVKDPRKTRLADKYLVREWIKEQIGEKYLTKWYGVWDDASDINFDTLPQSFVLKLNNGSGRNIIVKDKSQIDQAAVCQQLNKWKDNNYAYMSLELQYKDIVPKIICEEYLEGVAESVYDYDIYCFHGEPVYIWCIKGSHRPGCQASFYDKNWKMQNFSHGYPLDPVPAPRPEKLDQMLELSRLLSKDFEHVRVDWYNLPDGRVLFCEMTFSSWGGLKKWHPEKYDAIFGDLI